MTRNETSSLTVLFTLALALSALLAPAYAAPVAKVESGRGANGDYGQRRDAIGEQLRPKEGFQTKPVLGDVVPRMVSHGIIDMTKMEALYKERGGIPPELKQVLTQPTTTPLVVTGENANWLVNILWPIGLSNKMAINKRSPIVGKDIGNLASTAGWQLGKAKNGASYFNRYELIPLTREQQQRVWRIATSSIGRVATIPHSFRTATTALPLWR